jgi:hypothetical protein
VDGEAILQLLGALGIAGAVSAAVNAFFGRKKMSADVVKTINEAAGGIVERVERDNARLRASEAELEKKVDHCETRVQQAESAAWTAERRAGLLADTLLAYVSYVGHQADVIRKLGGQVKDPPEIPDAVLRIITTP